VCLAGVPRRGIPRLDDPADIGAWAKEHGFRLPPDAPEVLEFYASRSPIFLAAAFDADAAAERGQQVGDGTPVHVTIPTDNPWVPLRILALGKTGEERVEADVYLLTDDAPALLPVPTGDNGIRLDYSQAASASLLDDLRSDRGMEWIPGDAWLTEVAGLLRTTTKIDAKAVQDFLFRRSIDGNPDILRAGSENLDAARRAALNAKPEAQQASLGPLAAAAGR